MLRNLLIKYGGTSSCPFNIMIQQLDPRRVLSITRQHSDAPVQLGAERLHGHRTRSLWASG
jgi:hypothetical protein